MGSQNTDGELFSKNTGLCHVEILCIKSDACPVPEDKNLL